MEYVAEEDFEESDYSDMEVIIRFVSVFYLSYLYKQKKCVKPIKEKICWYLRKQINLEW